MKFEPIYPHITGVTERQQIEEIRRYLHQLSDRLELAFASVESRAVDLGLSSKVSSPDSDVGYGRIAKGCFLKCEERHIYVTFNCKLNKSGSAVQINAKPIPADYRPRRTVYSLCAASGGNIVRVFVTSSGDVFVEPSGSSGSISLGWIDGYIDYMI